MRDLKANKTVVDDSLRETKMHGTPGFPMGIYLDDFSEFENGYICWHWHEEPQLTMILEGTFTCQVEAEELLLQEGDIVFINAGLLHQIRPCVQEQGKLYSFIWKGELLGARETELFKECVEPVLAGRKGVPCLYWDRKHTDYAVLSGNLRQMIGLYREKEPAFQLKLVLKLTEIWLKIYESIPQNFSKADAGILRDEQRVKAALQYMQQHYQEPLSLEEIAEAVYISKSELCRGFQRTLRVTPMEFLMQYRIRQAVVLLKNPDLRILDVAEMTGFCSPSHLGMHFHKYMGCTPREYRKRK